MAKITADEMLCCGINADSIKCCGNCKHWEETTPGTIWDAVGDCYKDKNLINCTAFLDESDCFEERGGRQWLR
ncbi:MAG: hypothetical protein H6Q67_1488 [Firmicutes bacterium]|nr:hypothetical protein [Bacillota bacterium]